MVGTIRNKLQEERVCVVAALLAGVTSVFASPAFRAVNWHVIGALFVLMAAVLLLEQARVFETAASALIMRCGTARKLTLAMVSMTALLGMLVTNDVALITMIPLTLIAAKQSGVKPLWPCILQTLAANIGSSLTPVGNPQNLFLFSHYNMTLNQVFRTTLPFTAAGLAVILLMVPLLMPRQEIHLKVRVRRAGHRSTRRWGLLIFCAGVAAALKFIPLLPVCLVAGGVLITGYRPLIRRLDFFLLLTFVFFFIATDNLTQMTWLTGRIAECLSTQQSVVLAAAGLSQVISNVPAALFLAPFTRHASALLLGVSIGGMGTLVASLANLIAYRFYKVHHDGSEYLKKFHLLNVLFLGVFVLAGLCLIRG